MAELKMGNFATVAIPLPPGCGRYVEREREIERERATDRERNVCAGLFLTFPFSSADGHA
jgi:hypothetical protein